MGRFADELKLGLKPGSEIIWAGECTQGIQTGLNDRPFHDWHEYILSNGPLRGFPSLSLLSDPIVGDFKSQLIDGRRIDQAHITQRGNTLLADRWMEQLRTVARLPGDCDGDSNIDFNDLVCALFVFGDSYGPADCDRSGTVDFNDLVCALFNFTAE